MKLSGTVLGSRTPSLTGWELGPGGCHPALVRTAQDWKGNKLSGGDSDAQPRADEEAEEVGRGEELNGEKQFGPCV